MGFLDKLRDAFNGPKESPGEAYQRALHEQAAKGRMYECPECQNVFPKLGTRCPECEFDIAKSDVPRRLQLIKIYKGNAPEKAFMKQAAILARAGWRVTNQSMGGYNTMTIGNRKPTEIIVTYQRD